ncbi:MAG TPA: hypothetical protein VD969_21155 [Symbiobacteriaceae bacterium]|nr:hypothetical protein [Symbiobacteriaceae bacterium]
MRLMVALAMFLAAVLTLTSTLALESAQVTSGQTVTVTTTGSALLALTPGTGDGNAASTAYVSGTTGALVLDFTRGYGSGSGYAFAANRAGAAYKDLIKYKGLFKITNNSMDTQCISVYVPAGNAADLDAVYIRTAGEIGTDGWKVAGTGGARVSCRPTVTAGTQVLVDFWWRISTSESGVGSASFDVWVEGKR